VVIPLTAAHALDPQALASFPNKFDSNIVPRSTHHANVIRKQFVNCIPNYEAYEKEISKEDKAFVDELRRREKELLKWI
jgi:hypothetical protein